MTTLAPGAAAADGGNIGPLLCILAGCVGSDLCGAEIRQSPKQ